MESIGPEDKIRLFFIGNETSSSLPDHYVALKPICEKNEVLFMLRVVIDNEARDLKFNTLEDVVHFVKTYVKPNLGSNLEEISSIYKKEYKNKVLKRMF